MKEFKMCLNPATAKEGNEKSDVKGRIVLLLITTSLVLAEGLFISSNNIRVISTKKGNEIMFYTDKEIENNKAKGQTLTNYEEKNIKSRSLKRILKK